MRCRCSHFAQEHDVRGFCFMCGCDRYKPQVAKLAWLLLLLAAPAMAQQRNVKVINPVGDPANVTCVSGCAGGTPAAAADAMANPTAPQNLVYPLMFNGASWDRLRGDTANGIWVNCKTGCGSAAAVLMADAVTNPTIPQTAAFNVLYNGATWDRWRGDTTSGAWVNIKGGSIANTGFNVNNFPATYPPTTAAALADTVTNPSVPSTGAYISLFNGTTWDRARGTTTNGIWAEIKASVALSVNATQTGTWTVQPGNTANSTPWLTTDSADANTGSALPAKAAYLGVRDSTANLGGVIQCDKFAFAAISSAANTQLVAISGSTVIYVCSYVIEIQGIVTTAGTNKLNYGTGTACATGTVQVTPDYIGNVTAGIPFVVSQNAGAGYLFKTIAGQALCSTTTTTTVQKVFVTYAQF